MLEMGSLGAIGFERVVKTRGWGKGMTPIQCMEKGICTHNGMRRTANNSAFRCVIVQN